MPSDTTSSEVSGWLDQLSEAEQRVLTERGLSVLGLRRLATLPAGPDLVRRVLARRVVECAERLGLTTEEQDQALVEAAEVAVRAVDQADAGLERPLLLPLPGEPDPKLSPAEAATARAVQAELEALTGPQRMALRKAGMSPPMLGPVCDLPGGAELVTGMLNCHCRAEGTTATSADEAADARVRLVISATAQLKQVLSLAADGPDAWRPAPVGKPAPLKLYYRGRRPTKAEREASRAFKEQQQRDPRAVTRGWWQMLLFCLIASVALAAVSILSNSPLLFVLPALVATVSGLCFVVAACIRPPTTPWRGVVSVVLALSGVATIIGSFLLGGSFYLSLVGKQFTARSVSVSYKYSGTSVGKDWHCTVDLPNGHTQQLNTCTTAMEDTAGRFATAPIPADIPMVYDPDNLTAARTGTMSSAVHLGDGLAVLLGGAVVLLALTGAAAPASVRRLSAA
jgi:hypothetical protein